MNPVKFRRLSQLPDDYTRGAGVLPVAADTGNILLSLRGKHQESPGTWACWGGYSLIGEDLYKTAQREFHEETLYQGSITLFPVSVEQNVLQNFKFSTFVGVIPTEFDPVLDHETEDFMWYSISQLFNNIIPLHPEFKKVLPAIKPVLQNVMIAFEHLNENKKR